MLIAQITDTHIKLPGKLAYGRVDTAQMLRTCVAELVKLDPQPDLIVHTGDLADFGLPEEYAHLKAILAPLEVPILAVPGNHDAREPMRETFAADGYFPARGFLQFETSNAAGCASSASTHWCPDKAAASSAPNGWPGSTRRSARNPISRP